MFGMHAHNTPATQEPSTTETVTTSTTSEEEKVDETTVKPAEEDVAVDKEQGVVYAPSGKPLVPFETHHNGFWCDVCKVKVPKGTTMYGCRKCDYDMCNTCYFEAAAETNQPEDACEISQEAESEPEVKPEVVAEAVETATEVFSVSDAVAAMGLGEDGLSASIMAEIEHAVNENTNKAEVAAIEQSAAEAAAKAEAEALAEALAEAEAAAKAEAEAEAAAKAQAEAEAKAEAEAAAKAAKAEAEAAAKAEAEAAAKEATLIAEQVEAEE